MDSDQAKSAFRAAIKQAFVTVVRENKGSLGRKAAEIGIKRQQLEQYAAGTIPGADVVLAAFIKWGLKLRINDPHASERDPAWWECGMSARDRAQQKKTPGPVQLPLFRAIEDLGDSDMDVRILRKEAGRIQLAVDILFKERVG